MEPIKIQVSTSQLRTLLESDPKVYAQLESMACEKIAEEISRKIIAEKGAIQKRLKEEFTKETSELVRLAGYGQVPAKVQQAIQTVAAAEVLKAADRIIREAQAKVYEEVQKRIDEMIRASERKLVEQHERGVKLLQEAMNKTAAEFRTSSADIVEKLARASFIDVIREAKGVTG